MGSDSSSIISRSLFDVQDYVTTLKRLFTIPAGMAKIHYWRMMVPLGIGNIIFNVTFALLSVYAYYDWVHRFL